MARLLVVGDSHLSPSVAYADENWDAVVREVDRRRPDLVVHVGDISLDGARTPSDLAHARRRMGELTLPWRAVPGNHDIGDIGASSEPVDGARRAAYVGLFGATDWSVDVDGWRLVGIDIQALASPVADSGDVWRWLATALAGDQPTALFTHRPLRTHGADEVDDPDRYVTGAARERLLTLLAERHVELVVSGHIHQWRQVDDDGRSYVWVPSTWASLPDEIQPVIGTKVTGAVELDLGAAAVATLVRPPGLADVTSGVDFASPFDITTDRSRPPDC
jgi:3',5'-cyclic AMP phosphodiesterase CpdA